MTAPTSWTPVDLAALDDCAWETLKSSSFVVVACLHNGRDMHQYSGPVVLAIYKRLLNLQPALEEKLLPSMFRVTYVRSTNAYVVSYPTVLSGMLYYSTQNGFDANGEDDNLITLSNPMDYTATTQERGKRDITFGFAQLPPGALDSEADIATTVKNALLSVGLSLNHLQRRLDKYSLATGEFIMRFTMLPCFDSSNLRELRSVAPRTPALNTPIHILLSKEFVAEINVCQKCMYRRCICATPKFGAANNGKANHANAFARLLKKQRVE